VLWEKRYVMAGPEKTHITQIGRSLVKRLDGRCETPSTVY
jgi:hypothetical protein